MSIQSTYTNIVEIGSGGGGTVFRAYHVRMQKFVVLKKIHDSIQNNVDIRGELDILKNLRHSYLPTVLDFIVENGSVFTVMDYIYGESFESLLKKGTKFTQAQVLKYAAQLGEVISYLHGQAVPIVHGDIKPANIMLTPEDNICLIDFNISQLQNGQLNPNMGFSAGFAPPEQVEIIETMKHYYAAVAAQQQQMMAQQQAYQQQMQQQVPQQPTGQTQGGTMMLGAQPVVSEPIAAQQMYQQTYSRPIQVPPPVLRTKMDERTDLYSIGATLYAILCGKEPDADFAKIVPIDRMVENCSEGLVNLIKTCMQINPAKRFQTAEDYCKAVGNCAKVDKRYKRMVRRQEFAVASCILGIAGGIILSILGWERMSAENLSVYNKQIAQMGELVDAGKSAEKEFNELYKAAVSAYPQYSSAYYQKAHFMYNNRDYEALIPFIMEEAFDHNSGFNNDEMAGFYFLVANAYLELNQLENAVAYYKTAVNYNAYDSTYYADYAIALARYGDLEGAQNVLKEAVKMGLASDKVLLAEGEIKSRQGLIREAAESFAKCVEETEDSYVLFRAYIIWSELYDEVAKTEDNYRQQISVLKQAKNSVEAGYIPTVLERMAQSYINVGSLTENADDYAQAIECFKEIVDLGWDTYITHNNMGVLYERMGSYSEANRVYIQMLSKYGEDYRTYKRLAFLEAHIQSTKANRERDYAQFVIYYDKAKELFEESNAKADSDMEMQLLNQAYQQLVDGNWIETE